MDKRSIRNTNDGGTVMKGIPVVPMVNILKQYAAANDLPFRMNRWEEIVRCFSHYCLHVCHKN